MQLRLLAAVVAVVSCSIGPSVGDESSFYDHFWTINEEVSGRPSRAIFGVSITPNNVVSLTTLPAGNIVAVIRGHHGWIEAIGGTASYRRADGTYDTITLINP